MKITDGRIERKSITFENLNYGDVFEYIGEIYLKLNSRNESNNALNLGANVLATFSDDVVTLLEAELVIRGTKHD